MKIEETREVLRKETILIKRICDICKCEYSLFDWDAEEDLERLKLEGNFCEVELKMRYGWRYADGGHGKEIEFDICPVCFEHKVVPALQEIGAFREWKVWDW